MKLWSWMKILTDIIIWNLSKPRKPQKISDFFNWLCSRTAEFFLKEIGINLLWLLKVERYLVSSSNSIFTVWANLIIFPVLRSGWIRFGSLNPFILSKKVKKSLAQSYISFKRLNLLHDRVRRLNKRLKVLQNWAYVTNMWQFVMCFDG